MEIYFIYVICFSCILILVHLFVFWEKNLQSLYFQFLLQVKYFKSLIFFFLFFTPTDIRDDFQRQLNVTILTRTGETTQLDCNAPRGFPIPKIYWKTQDGKQVKTIGRFALTDDGNLVVDEVKAADAGDYSCVVENIAGTRQSPPITLRVLSAPTMLVAPHDITALTEDNIVLECRAKGYPEPIVSWRRNDSRRALYTSRITSQEPGILRISRITIADEGIYICQAEVRT